MKTAEVHKMNTEELTIEAARLRRKIFDLRSQGVTEKLENPKQIGNFKRDLARVLTEAKSRQQKEVR